MNDASAAVATAERPVVTSQPPRSEVQKPSQKDSKEVRQFSKMAEVAIEDKNKSTETLAGIAGWGMMGRVNGRLQEMQSQVIGLLNEKKIPDNKADEYLKKIGEIQKQAQENIMPVLKNLDEAVDQERKSSTLNPFMRDLNYHHIKHDIKGLEGNDNFNAKSELQQLTSDLKNSEKDRGEMKPEDDEVIKLALTLRGEKGLPEKFKDLPLEAIDDFFQHQLKNIVRNEKSRAQMAKKLGVTPQDLTNLIAVYEQGSQIDSAISGLENEIDPKKKNKLMMVGGILGAFSALLAWMAIKKESSGQPA